MPDAVPLTTRYAQVRDLDLAIAYHEAGSGRPLLCVHGNFASKRWFTEQLHAPPPGWRVIALDLPNFGESAALPEAISIPAYARYLRGFIDALELDDLVLLGHSLGGAVAQAYAATHPAALAGLVLVAAPAPNGHPTPAERYPILASFRENPQLLAEALKPTIPTRRPDYFDALVRDALAMQAAAFTGNAQALERYDVTAALKAATCPALVVRGSLDYLISEEAARRTAAALKHAELQLLEGIGHSPQLEDPPRFGALLNTFLEGLP